MNHLVSIILGVAFLCAHVCAENPGVQTNKKQVALDGSYGTLKYKGHVKREEKGPDYQYTITELTLSYNPFSRTNSTREIKVKEIEFLATKRPASGDGPWTRTFVKTHPTGHTLTFTSSTVTLKNLVFTVPKTVIEEADSVGLSVTDGSMLWPLDEELK